MGRESFSRRTTFLRPRGPDPLFLQGSFAGKERIDAHDASFYFGPGTATAVGERACEANLESCFIEPVL